MTPRYERYSLSTTLHHTLSSLLETQRKDSTNRQVDLALRPRANPPNLPMVCQYPFLGGCLTAPKRGRKGDSGIGRERSLLEIKGAARSHVGEGAEDGDAPSYSAVPYVPEGIPDLLCCSAK